MRCWPLALLVGCVQPLQPHPAEDTSDLAVGDMRIVELWMLGFEVEGYEQRIDLATLQSLPQSVLDDIWLLDMPLQGLIENSLGQLRDMPVDDALLLPQSAQNMRTLLRMSPDNAILDGTSMEELLSLSAALGIPAANPLADLFEVGVTDTVLPLDAAAYALVTGLIGTHPASQWRTGPVDAAHPDGQWPVAPNSLPITVGDVVTNFEALPDRFAPTETEWGLHPGFIEEASGFSVIEDAFAMAVKVNINAVPYRGCDLTNATTATVNSTGSQIEDMFATGDPDWMRIDGLIEEPYIAALTVNIFESDEFISIGDARDPLPTGNSAAWDLPPWEIEHLVASMALEAAGDIAPHAVEYKLGTGTTAFEAVLDETGWLTFATFNDVGNPPPPQYLWDVELELAQVRMHDGGLPEGGADITFTLSDVSVGVTASELTEQIAANLADNPAALRELASAITENSVGDADFYYYRPPPDADEAEAGDWLYFLTERDLPLDSEREYTYAHPGFYADAGLTQKISDNTDVHGDNAHEKVRIASGDVLYIEDDLGAVYELVVAPKPSVHRISLEVTRSE